MVARPNGASSRIRVERVPDQLEVPGLKRSLTPGAVETRAVPIVWNGSSKPPKPEEEALKSTHEPSTQKVGQVVIEVLMSVPIALAMAPA